MDKILYEVKISERIFIKPFVLAIVWLVSFFVAGMVAIVMSGVMRESAGASGVGTAPGFLILAGLILAIKSIAQGIKGLATYINTKIFITQDEIVKKNSSTMLAKKIQDIKKITINGGDVIIYDDNSPLLLPCICNTKDIKKMILELAPHVKIVNNA